MHVYITVTSVQAHIDPNAADTTPGWQELAPQLASQPMQQGGAMTPDSCDKAMAFIIMCDSFHIPLIFLSDTPGFLVGKQVEHNRLLHKTVALGQCLAQVRVPELAQVPEQVRGRPAVPVAPAAAPLMSR